VRKFGVHIDEHLILDRLLTLIPVWLSLSVHEWAHAWTAFRLGDDTAARLGRMTLNPLAHIDPVGTLLLPLLGIPFGWAKPVPVQPHRFYARVNMRTGMMYTAVAGPLSNLVLSILCLAAMVVLLLILPIGSPVLESAYPLLTMMILINILLALFNLIPVPPLDGSRIADALMPQALRPGWESFYQAGPVALIALLVLPRLLGVHLFAWPLHAVQTALLQITIWLAR
jgi:Zn-dependent protease